jgi:hypothetical protein
MSCDEAVRLAGDGQYGEHNSGRACCHARGRDVPRTGSRLAVATLGLMPLPMAVECLVGGKGLATHVADDGVRLP